MKALLSRRVILHCSATPPSMDIGVDWIRNLHLDRGWRDVGYHYFITREGEVQIGRSLNEYGAHCKGHNDSIGICYAGGIDEDGAPEDNMTELQEIAFLDLYRSLRMVFGELSLHGHNEYSAKACPSFIVKEKYPFIYHDSEFTS